MARFRFYHLLWALGAVLMAIGLAIGGRAMWWLLFFGFLLASYGVLALITWEEPR